MRGWQFFTHSVGLVFRNLDAALRLSLLPYCAHVAAQLYLFLNPELLMPTEPGAEGVPAAVEPLQAAIFLGLQMLAFLSSLWIAVLWHRYVLREEIAAGWQQPFPGGLVLGYLGRTLLLVLLMMLAMLTLSIPTGLVMAASSAMVIPMLFSSVVAVFFLFLRLGVILPAGAMGQRLTLHEAWRATGAESGAILALAAIMVGFFVLLQVPNFVAGAPGSVFTFVYTLCIGWVLTMVGSSLLTTLYGICVEKRSIE